MITMNLKKIFSIISAILIWLILLNMEACQTKPSNSQAQSPSTRLRVAIQPLGNIQPQYALEAQKALENYYGFKVVVLPKRPLLTQFNNQAILKKYHLANYPLRYRADSLLNDLRRTIPPNFDYIVGLTDQLISCTNRNKKGDIEQPLWLNVDWQIFGYGFRPGKSCVVSMASYTIDNQDIKLVKSRIRKVVLHEIGHNLGLDHCLDKDCFMRQVDLRFALKSLDAKKEELCINCQNILKSKKNLVFPKKNKSKS
jgi:archaemetzincin